jgi:hypothetical protein
VLAASGRLTRERLSSYETALVSRFGPPGSPAAAARVPHVLRAPLAGLVLAVPFLSRHMVLDPTFLHRRQAPLTDPAPYFVAPALGLRARAQA